MRPGSGNGLFPLAYGATPVISRPVSGDGTGTIGSRLERDAVSGCCELLGQLGGCFLAGSFAQVQQEALPHVSGNGQVHLMSNQTLWNSSFEKSVFKSM